MLKGIVLAFLSYAAYAMSDASIKFLNGRLDPFEVVFIGTVFGFAAVPFMMKRDDRWADLYRTTRRKLWLLRALVAVTGSVSSVIAFTALPMAEAFALIFLLPLFVTIFSVLFLGEKVGWRRWSAVIAGFVGVLVVLRPGFRELGIGHLAAIVGGLSGAVAIIILRVLGPTEKRVTLYGSGLAGPLVAAAILMIPGFRWPTLELWLPLLSYGLLGALGNILLMVAAQFAPASRIAPPQYSQMIWGVGFGYFLFGDRLDVFMVIGIAIIMGAGLVTFVREEQKTRWWRRTPVMRARS
ncbi:S-adenosylmethionine uptake transporter [Faunimonas pinastri]|uniref:S-adenosylmethionine uptake transporter n=1 Tax=Faunimonas pinastri TaxID=1855383 RepID=A0A1H9PQ15_9HYPH|nr:DMT family transporter [Faunimonas pinastri]SER50268.1 S-adenosylmethionine uptake transporter [Faunimonas pinastri]